MKMSGTYFPDRVEELVVAFQAGIDLTRTVPAIPGATSQASKNPSSPVRYAGARQEIHSLDEFLFPARPCRFVYRRSSFPGRRGSDHVTGQFGVEAGIIAEKGQHGLAQGFGEDIFRDRRQDAETAGGIEHTIGDHDCMEAGGRATQEPKPRACICGLKVTRSPKVCT